MTQVMEEVSPLHAVVLFPLQVYRVSLLQRELHQHLEVLVRSLIILCTVLSIVLSIVSVCDGLWLQTPGGRMFGLWLFCTTQPVAGVDGRVPDLMHHKQSAFEALAPRLCITQLGQSGVGGVEVGMGCCRALVSLAVVSAIFGLEFQVISRLSEGQDSARRWVLGSALMLVAASLSASGVLVFVALLRGFVSLAGFTLTFWCQFTAAALFLLNGLAARYIRHMNTAAPLTGILQTC